MSNDLHQEKKDKILAKLPFLDVLEAEVHSNELVVELIDDRLLRKKLSGAKEERLLIYAKTPNGYVHRVAELGGAESVGEFIERYDSRNFSFDVCYVVEVPHVEPGLFGAWRVTTIHMFPNKHTLRTLRAARRRAAEADLATLDEDPEYKNV